MVGDQNPDLQSLLRYWQGRSRAQLRGHGRGRADPSAAMLGGILLQGGRIPVTQKSADRRGKFKMAWQIVKSSPAAGRA